MSMSKRAAKTPESTVRFPFVIYGFSLAEMGKLGAPFLLGRALEEEGPNLFDIGGQARKKVARFLGLRSLIGYLWGNWSNM
jgi:hypothetical protein